MKKNRHLFEIASLILAVMLRWYVLLRRAWWVVAKAGSATDAQKR